MRIATVLFTYQRSWHTKKVEEALSLNTRKPEKLFIFQDGIREGTNMEEWKKVGDIIRGIDWCDTELHIANEKKGCAKSVIEGINYALQEYDAVIVLEDDCVPHPQFMAYMYQALEKYEKNTDVYTIGGHAWDVDLPKSNMDAYFNRRTSSWGWGTWKDRWERFEEDYLLVYRLKETEEGKRRLNIWGPDLESMVVGNIKGTCDAWDVFWSLTVIANNGVCLSPYESLIHNIGMDGSGTHHITRKDEPKENYNKYKNGFSLPDSIQVSKECEREFSFLFSGIYAEKKLQLYQQILLKWLSIKQCGVKLDLGPDLEGSTIAIWGKGCICSTFMKEIEDRLNVKYILETYPSLDEYEGKKVIGIDELSEEIRTIVVIPFFDMKCIAHKVRKKRREIVLIGIDELINRTWEKLEGN